MSKVIETIDIGIIPKGLTAKQFKVEYKKLLVTGYIPSKEHLYKIYGNYLKRI